MKKIIYAFLLIAVAGCDDGDIIIEDFSFDGIDLKACLPQATDGSRNYVFYKVDNTNFESLSLQFTTNEEIFNVDDTYGPFDIGPANTVEYRKYDAAPGTDYFCSSVPPAEPRVNDALKSAAGRFFITTENQSLTSQAALTNTEAPNVDTDNDGVPSNQEPSGQDTDGDGLEDKVDFDDDGDNVPTVDEGVVIIDGVVSISMSRDTDGDGILDYLDNDDDGDGILTIQEDLNGDLDPRNDMTGTLPNYLNPSVATAASPAIDLFKEHSYSRTAQLTLRLENLILTRDNEEVVFDNFNNFGTFIRPQYQVRVTPDFTEMESTNP
ncbi:hypothetical protein [Nonlabens antarcticus]|uniref:hypothetical protein n=1 Tax=Nonlabens antarcticus TaxID=392714 RepID=UPI00189178BC|nr:hypothetical protein [Nonlabens antarcticus]